MNKKVTGYLTIGAILVLILGIFMGGVFKSKEIVANNSFGYKMLEKERYLEAEGSFRKVLKLDKKNVEANIGLFKALAGEQKFKEALSIMQVAIKEDPGNSEIYEEQIKLLSVIPPKISLEGGSYSGYQNVEIVPGTIGEKVFYSLEENDKSPDKLYSKPIRLKEGKTVLRVMSKNSLGVTSEEIKHTYIVSVNSEQRFKEQLANGIVEGMEFSLGANINDILSKWGTPSFQGEYNGGKWYTFEKAAFATHLFDNTVSTMAFSGKSSFYGIKIGDSIESVKNQLGRNPLITKVNQGMEMANEGDKTVMSYIAGDNTIDLYCNESVITMAVITKKE